MLNMLRRDFAGSLAAVTAVAFARPVGAANMEDKPDLVGTWKVVDAISRDAQGKELPKPFGPKGMGIATRCTRMDG